LSPARKLTPFQIHWRPFWSPCPKYDKSLCYNTESETTRALKRRRPPRARRSAASILKPAVSTARSVSRLGWQPPMMRVQAGWTKSWHRARQGTTERTCSSIRRRPDGAGRAAPRRGRGRGRRHCRRRGCSRSCRKRRRETGAPPHWRRSPRLPAPDAGRAGARRARGRRRRRTCPPGTAAGCGRSRFRRRASAPARPPSASAANGRCRLARPPPQARRRARGSARRRASDEPPRPSRSRGGAGGPPAPARRASPSRDPSCSGPDLRALRSRRRGSGRSRRPESSPAPRAHGRPSGRGSPSPPSAGRRRPGPRSHGRLVGDGGRCPVARRGACRSTTPGGFAAARRVASPRQTAGPPPSDPRGRTEP